MYVFFKNSSSKNDILYYFDYLCSVPKYIWARKFRYFFKFWPTSLASIEKDLGIWFLFGQFYMPKGSFSTQFNAQYILCSRKKSKWLLGPRVSSEQKSIGIMTWFFFNQPHFKIVVPHRTFWLQLSHTTSTHYTWRSDHFIIFFIISSTRYFKI